MNLTWKFVRIGVVVSFVAAGASSRASAATAQTTFIVTANVTANCTISATGISFTYDPIGANASTAALSERLHGRT